ncbi:TIGR02300 family protein [Labrenzia sp. 011]|uniref:TIGR02300 family protein n=1 Tax=Labrenzia sp. 011 TaxID=2171494 RepID=UPI000D50FAE6|nr:TIGR02300 family protein [Labrenzia sp. 011]PVB61423.1 TIGR02300 family protein [Labrenzia sp. 011]
MAKPELGTKRLCPSCGAKYYDLNRDPITCPKCGTIFEVVMTSRAAKAAKVVETPEEEEEEDLPAAEIVPLEEADAETEDTGEVVPELDDTDVDIAEDDDDADDGVFIDDEDEDADEVPAIRVEIDEDPDR